MEKKVVVVLGVIIISLVFLFVILGNSKAEQIQLDFSKVMPQLNGLYANTPNDQEFVALLTIDNLSVNAVNVIGYRSVNENHIALTSYLPENLSAYSFSIHSHPQTHLCILSETDKVGEEQILCIMCDLNKIKCFKNGN